MKDYCQGTEGLRLFVIVANVYHQAAGHWLAVPGWLSFTIFSIMSFFPALLVWVLQADVPQVEEIASLQA